MILLHQVMMYSLMAHIPGSEKGASVGDLSLGILQLILHSIESHKKM